MALVWSEREKIMKKRNVLLTMCVRSSWCPLHSRAPISRWLRNDSRHIQAHIQHVTFLMRKTTTKWKPQKRKPKSPAVSFFTRGSMKRLLHVRRLRPLTISQSDEVEFVQQPWMAAAAERKERRVMQVCLLKCVWKLCIKMRCSCWSQVSVPFRQEELFKKHLRIFSHFVFGASHAAT